MKAFLMLFATFIGLALVGCEKGPEDRQADVIRDQSQKQADQVRDTTQDQAEQVRDQAGRDVLGSAKTDSAENKADKIESEGEKTADKIESEGEKTADKVEEGKPPTP
jgi:hypothetical protein